MLEHLSYSRRMSVSITGVTTHCGNYPEKRREPRNGCNEEISFGYRCCSLYVYPLKSVGIKIIKVQ